MPRQLTEQLRECSSELENSISRGNYRQALACWQRLRRALDQGRRTGPAGPQTPEYRAALLQLSETLKVVRVRATLERDRVGRALNHCASLQHWVDANRNTF